eukprot:4824585-Pleurochrysis_carterae.AAC.1
MWRLRRPSNWEHPMRPETLCFGRPAFGKRRSALGSSVEFLWGTSYCFWGAAFRFFWARHRLFGSRSPFEKPRSAFRERRSAVVESLRRLSRSKNGRNGFRELDLYSDL